MTTGYYGLYGQPFAHTPDGYLLRIITSEDTQTILRVHCVHPVTLVPWKNLTNEWVGSAIPKPWHPVEVDDSLSMDEGL